MSRIAVFVDAGYLYGAGVTALVGEGKNRGSVRLILDKTLEKLKTTARAKAPEALLLRIYWYDGVVSGRRTTEHANLAIAEDVKLRLGTVTGGRQKGVDSLIVTDLIELARNHSIDDAVLLSGDEDLRIGVQIAQSFGVRVHLIGIEPSRGNQSNALQEEADTLTEWSKQDLQEIIVARVSSEREASSDSPPVAVVENPADDNLDEVFTKVVLDVISSIEESNLPEVAAELAQGEWSVPYRFDRILLGKSKELTERELDAEEKRRLRSLFREILKSRVS